MPRATQATRRLSHIQCSLGGDAGGASHYIPAYLGSFFLFAGTRVAPCSALADRIAHGPIPIDEALPIAKQIAEALEAAHELSVIHRDLKPANIKVREEGTVKVLDFGLAKALDTTPEGDPSQSPTLTAAATNMGVFMGTAASCSICRRWLLKARPARSIPECRLQS